MQFNARLAPIAHTQAVDDGAGRIGVYDQLFSFLFGKKIYEVILNIIPLLTVGFVAAAFFVSGITSIAIGLALFQWTFLGLHIKKVNAFHAYVSRKKNVL